MNTNSQKVRIKLNAPAVLTFALVCFAAQLLNILTKGKDCFAVPAFSIECNDRAGETGDKEKNADGFKAKRNDRLH